VRPVVFLGPSLERAEAERLLDADYRPPAAAGDLLAATLDRPPAILLVDGVFERVPSVWHKEVLHALELGVPVYGASSMGALRAAELSSFGMVGVGRVFARYASGELEDDDEVAVVHADAEHGFRPLSEAMVSLRDGLVAAEVAGLLEPAEHAALLALAKALHYPDRSWPRLAMEGTAAGLDQGRMRALLAWARASAPNTKRADAIQALERVRMDLEAPPSRPPPTFALERSVFFERLHASVRGRLGIGVEDAQTARWARVVGGQERARLALSRVLAREEARRRGLTPSDQAVQAAVDAFRRAAGLGRRAALERWMEERGLDDDALIQLFFDDLAVEALLAADTLAVDRALADELKREGRWDALRVQARAQTEAAIRRGLIEPQPEDAGVDPDAVLAGFEGRHRALARTVEGEARALGFARASELWTLFTRAYLAALDADGAAD
jgi:hypothetical protein